MSIHLTPQQSRPVAIILFFAVAALLIGAIALPTWQLHTHYDYAIESFSDHLQRYRRVISMRPAIEEAVREVEGKNIRRFFLQGTSLTLAAAELQRLVTQTVETHKGHVVTSQVLPVKDEANKKGMTTKITVSVQMNASVIPLQLILHALETNEPYLFIEQFTLRSNHGRAQKVAPGIQPEFSVQLTISAYLLTDGVVP